MRQKNLKMQAIAFGAMCLLMLTCCTQPTTTSVATPHGEKRDLNTYVEDYNGDRFCNEAYSYADMAYAFHGTTSQDFRQWQDEFRDKMKDLLGLSKIEQQLAGYQLKAEQLDSEDIGYATRQRWIIWTEPNVQLPIIIIVPKDIKGKAPLVFTVQGHSKNPELYAGIYENEEDRKDGEEGGRNIGIQAAKRGYIAITPTTRGFGKTRLPKEIRRDETSSCETLMLRELLVGRTLIGDRVWDMSRVLDWALQALPVDERNVVMTGNSGGGTVSLFAGAMDERFSIVVPSSYFCTFVGSIGNISHCECNYIPDMLNYGEMADVAGLTAPRPFCSLSGKKDHIFPIEETRKAFAHLQTIYQAAGVPDNCELFEGSQGHQYYPEGAWPFIEKHLKK